MRQSRFYVDSKLATGERIALPKPVSHHIANVLRMASGQCIVLFDGSGDDYLATLQAIHNKEVSVEVGECIVSVSESPLQLTLAQGVSKGQKMDFTLQKAVELGVSRVVPILNQRSSVKLKQQRLEHKLQHWRNVMVSAAEQSGRSIISDISAPMSLQDWLSQDDNPHKLLLLPAADKSLCSIELSVQPISLLVGSEGGLNDDETTAALASGYRAVRLGPRVLRTETAALVALSILQSRYGDLA